MDQKQIIKKEEELIKKEEKIISSEEKLSKEEISLIKRLRSNLWISYGVIAVGVALLVGGVLYYKVSSGEIYIDKADIEAPTIALSPSASGVLEELYVREGDMVQASEAVARVGNELIKAKIDGQVIAVENSVGKIVNPGEAVVAMIDKNELHAVGQLDENKGLADVRVGQAAVFTVDAFGSKKFGGIVDAIAPTSNSSGVVFSISDKREVKAFDIKVRFDTNAYPELQNGMSARIWIYK